MSADESVVLDAKLAGRLAELAAAARHDGPPPIRCPWPECRCTHREPCVAGWVETETTVRGKPHAAASPCRVCRPELYELFASGDDHDQLMHGARARGRHVRTAAKIKQRESTTVVDDQPWWQRDES